MKKRFLSMFALLLMAATGAWADITVTWSSSDMSGLSINFDDGSAENNTIKGITATASTGGAGNWYGNGINPSSSTTITFTSSVGNIKSITIKAEDILIYSDIPGGWTLTDDYKKLSWSGDASTSVSLALSGSQGIGNISEIEFTIESATTYSVTLAEGTEDAENWNVPAEAAEGAEVTATYSGEKKVKSVKAVKKGAATIPVTSITLNKTETSIEVGSTETLSVTEVAPDNATDKTYTWKTSDETKATVDADGKVTAVAEGTVTIYAEANDGSGVKGNCTVTVTPATITVTINQSDWGSESFTTGIITKGGVTVSAGNIDPFNGNLMGDVTFSTTLGKFTKIVVTAKDCNVSGTGWSGNSSSMTWAGTPASTVSFSGNVNGHSETQTTIVCTIVPKN